MINVLWKAVVTIVVGSKRLFYSLCSRVKCKYSSAMLVASRQKGMFIFFVGFVVEIVLLNLCFFYGRRLESRCFFVSGVKVRSVFP